MAVTQKQIAAHLGISQSQVAHALKGYDCVSQKTKQRVEEAARELGYGSHSNNAARALRARRNGSSPRTDTLCVLMGDFFEGMHIQDVPFYRPILQGLKEEANRRKIDLSFFSTSCDYLPRVLTEGGVDGVISLYTDRLDDEHVSPEARRRIVCPALRIGDGRPGESAVRPDDQQGIYLTTKHLIELGHRRIAYIGDLRGNSYDNLAYRSRLEGYFQALGESGIPLCNDLMETHIGIPDHDAGAKGMAKILKRNSDVTAVVCVNDTSALGAIDELKRHGLRVPEDVSVTGFDDVWEAYGEDPALTTIYFDRFEMGRRAIESICLTIEAQESKDSNNAGEHQLLPVKLVERASTTTPRQQKS